MAIALTSFASAPRRQPKQWLLPFAPVFGIALVLLIW